MDTPTKISTVTLPGGEQLKFSYFTTDEGKNTQQKKQRLVDLILKFKETRLIIAITNPIEQSAILLRAKFEVRRFMLK